MIQHFKIDGSTLQWETGAITVNKIHKKVHSAINNEKEVLVFCEDTGHDVVILYSNEGMPLATMSSSEEFSIMYLQKHPRFGLCAVCSVKGLNDTWDDRYFAYDGVSSFTMKTFSR